MIRPDAERRSSPIRVTGFTRPAPCLVSARGSMQAALKRRRTPIAGPRHRRAAPGVTSSRRALASLRATEPGAGSCARDENCGGEWRSAGRHEAVARKKQTRQPAGRGLIHRGSTWQTVRLSGAHFRGPACVSCHHSPVKTTWGIDSQLAPVTIHTGCLFMRLWLMQLRLVVAGRRGKPGRTDRNGSDPPGRGPGTGLELGVFSHPAPALQGSLPFQ